jgi:hypothetical protein
MHVHHVDRIITQDLSHLATGSGMDRQVEGDRGSEPVDDHTVHVIKHDPMAISASRRRDHAHIAAGIALLDG